MAEGAGFEPAVGFCLRTLSKRVPSTTQPPLRKARSVTEGLIAGKNIQRLQPCLNVSPNVSIGLG